MSDVMLSKQKGFSLVELSIVLVILGLLIGGVLTGRNLIRAAEIRSVSADMDSFRSALYTFKGKYFALPGDMPNAVKFWGAQAGSTADGADAACVALTHASPAIGTETCNGNGNGQVSASYEMMRFWQHLANAGLISGKYTGVTANSVSSDRAHTPGLNCPASKVGNGGYAFYHVGNPVAVYFFPGSYGNSFTFGSGPNSHETILPIIPTEDAWNIDLKIDDGLPGIGKVRPRNPEVSGTHSNCSTSTDPAVAVYNLTYKNNACGLYFITGL